MTSPKKELVFVYGTLKKGFGLHQVLKNINAEFKGNWITDPKYTMFALGGFPGVRPNGGDSIHGEVYAVPNMKELDSVEGYPSLYTREKLSTEWGDSWIYIYNRAPRSPVIKISSGIW